jgi:hypothetical protein
MLVSLPDFRSEMADSRGALGSMCLAIRRPAVSADNVESNGAGRSLKWE